MPAEALERNLAATLAADIGWYRHSFGALILTGVVGVLFAVDPAFSANYSECMAQAVGMSGDARQQFMGSCLSNKVADTQTRNCANGKPCGKSCIARDKVCRK
jgi:psiF repeat-containing protein